MISKDLLGKDTIKENLSYCYNTRSSVDARLAEGVYIKIHTEANKSYSID